MPTKGPKKLLLASPRGFCAGVKRAIDILDQLCQKYPGETIYCYHQIVHNKYVVSDFEKKGVKFINDLGEVPKGSILVFSSHGVSPVLKRQAEEKGLKAFDATCPFVLKTHVEVKKYALEGKKIVYIGQSNHDEALGTVGEAPKSTTIIQTLEEISSLNIPSDKEVAFVTQTTLSFDETEHLRQSLKNKFPKLIEPLKSDICMATQNRQNGVKELVRKGAKVIIVLGSANSSNSSKLKKVAEQAGAKAYLVDDITEVDLDVINNLQVIGLTAGASLPENKLSEAIDWFRKTGDFEIEEIVVADEKKVEFASIKI